MPAQEAITESMCYWLESASNAVHSCPMKRLHPEASDEEILAAAREWIGLLADRRYVEAHAWLRHRDPSRWTSPELITTVIRNYGFVEPRADGKVFQVTPIEAASRGEGEH